MLNKALTKAWCEGMLRELLLATFIMGVGLCIAGAGTHLYQWLARQQALLRYDGPTVMHMLGNLVMSFVCGPYIMLKLGMQIEDGARSMTGLLIAAFVAFGWAFLTGLLFVGAYVAVQS
jgi:hypothetical protein